MKFLTKDEADLLEKKLRREISQHAGPKSALYYESGADRDYATAASAIAHSAGRFSEATLIYSFCVSGDGWDEPAATSERWIRYKRWRAANSENRRLYEAPGHCFEASEVEQLSQVIEFSLELGWDAVVTAKPGRQLLFLSHDDRLDIYHGFGGRSLVRQLTDLGYWRRASL